MKLELEVYDCLCELSTFVINDVDADNRDFGEKYDHGSEYAEDYACGNMQFDPKNATQTILDKYKITLTEYNEICSKLETVLGFGSCGWCV